MHAYRLCTTSLYIKLSIMQQRMPLIIAVRKSSNISATVCSYSFVYTCLWIRCLTVCESLRCAFWSTMVAPVRPVAKTKAKVLDVKDLGCWWSSLVLSGTVDPRFKSGKEDFANFFVCGVSVHSHQFPNGEGLLDGLPSEPVSVPCSTKIRKVWPRARGQANKTN